MLYDYGQDNETEELNLNKFYFILSHMSLGRRNVMVGKGITSKVLKKFYLERV